MTNTDIKQGVLEILRTEMNLTVPSDDADLIAGGQLDSLALVDLLSRLEARFGVTVELFDLDLDDLRTPLGLAAVVEKRQTAAA